MFLDLQKPHYLQQAFVKTHIRTESPCACCSFKGLLDSQHSVRCCHLHPLRKSGQVPSHLDFGVTRPFTLLKMCLGRPDTWSSYMELISSQQPCVHGPPSPHCSSQHPFHSLSPHTSWCRQGTDMSQAIRFVMGQIKSLLVRKCIHIAPSQRARDLWSFSLVLIQQFYSVWKCFYL